MDLDEENLPPDICPGCYCPKDARAAKCRRCWRFGVKWWMDLPGDLYDKKMAEIHGEIKEPSP